MQSDTWGAVPQQFNNHPKFGRASHNRDSSLSSVASTAAPSSPYSIRANLNPQVAINDFRIDGLPDMTTATDTNDANGAYYQLAKSLTPYAGYQNLDQSLPELAYPVTLSGPIGKPRADRTSLLPAPDFGNASVKSQPASVASSIASDSPATPTNGETENERRSKGYHGTAPRLDRTMTDVYGDELYSPNFAITSTSPPQPHMSASPLNNELFAQRLSAANSQHLSASHSPASNNSRDKSPFKTDSPMGSSLSGQGQMFNTAQRMREESKARHEAQFQQALGRSGEPETPKTISPKDAVLEFNDSEGDANFPLFPQDPTSNFELDLSKAMVPQPAQVDLTQQIMPGHSITSAQPPNFLGSGLAQSLQVPQQYPFIARTQTSHTPPRLSSAGSSSSGSVTEMPLNKPQSMSRHAHTGTYTCTYHNCTLRFETPALLQKHKREGHRQTHGLGLGNHGMTSSHENTQAGPHHCSRINPATGKPCDTMFSRPYDLTRHEDTIHNARKRKVRCDLCTEEKTFSRADALTRHYRVCHPEAELPGKHRRRG